MERLREKGEIRDEAAGRQRLKQLKEKKMCVGRNLIARARGDHGGRSGRIHLQCCRSWRGVAPFADMVAVGQIDEIQGGGEVHLGIV